MAILMAANYFRARQKHKGGPVKRLHLRNAGHTNAPGSGRAAKDTALAHRDAREHSQSQEDEKRKVQERSQRLRLSATRRRALGDVVVVQVRLVCARVAADASGNGGCSSKSEDTVQEVKNEQNDGPCKGGNEVSQNTVD